MRRTGVLVVAAASVVAVLVARTLRAQGGRTSAPADVWPPVPRNPASQAHPPGSHSPA
ncbi:MAG: hypothetical protein M0029_02115 [Actinomycetota bacterium]|nr:hypothetical protein [Actinomycetota bacterium]